MLPGDSEVTRRLARELDFVRNLRPLEVTYPVSSQFVDLLRGHAVALGERYGVERRDRWPADRATTLYARARSPELAYVHSTKLRESFGGRARR
jgi:hypothetical protein